MTGGRSMKIGKKKQESSSTGNGRISVEERVGLVEDSVIEIKNAVYDIKVEMETFRNLGKQINKVVEVISSFLPKTHNGVSNNKEKIIINIEDSINSRGSDCEIVNPLDHASRTTTPKSRVMPPRACNAKKLEKKLAEPKAKQKLEKKLAGLEAKRNLEKKLAEPEVEPDENVQLLNSDLNFNKIGLLNYIHGEGHEKIEDNEVMAEIQNEYVTRMSLRKLAPKKWLDSGVINIYINMLTLEQRMSSYISDVPRAWFMPDHFAQFAQKTDLEDRGALMKLHRDFLGEFRYGGSIEMCEKIFIPMLDVNHWYLLMVNFKEKCVFILDSLQQRECESEGNEKIVLRVIQKALEVSFEERYVADINKFPIQKPTWVPQQCNSYDCGVYMLKFMELHAELKEGMRLDLDNLNSDSVREQMLVDIIYYMHNYHRKWFSNRFGQPKKPALYSDSEENS